MGRKDDKREKVGERYAGNQLYYLNLLNVFFNQPCKSWEADQPIKPKTPLSIILPIINNITKISTFLLELFLPVRRESVQLLRT